MRTRPFPANFPRRNRIIAGLSLGTVLVEGGDKSGSLITARLAAEEGREVFAVPGPATSELSVAPNRMLQLGATMVQSPEDILREIGLGGAGGAGTSSEKKQKPAVSADHAAVLSYLGGQAVPKEILAQRLQKDIPALSSLLFEMEMQGLIRTIPGGGVLKT